MGVFQPLATFSTSPVLRTSSPKGEEKRKINLWERRRKILPLFELL
jgi:hypothetical protein